MKAMALVQIFLLLSVHPISAYRAHEVASMVTGLESARTLVQEEFERAIQKEAQDSDFVQAVNDTHLYIGESLAPCPQRKDDFERRSGKLKDRYDTAAADGNIDPAEAVWVILKARSLANTLAAAKSKGCEWTNHKENIDMSAVDALLATLKSKQPCFGHAARVLEDAKDSDAEGQKKAFIQGLGTLLSQDSECKVPETALDDLSGKSEATETSTSIEEDENALELAYLASQYEKDKKDQPKISESLAQLQLMDIKHLEAGTRAAVGSGNFIEQVGRFVTFIILMIIWGLLCGLVYGLITAALTLVLCMLKTVVTSVLNAVYGAEQWVLGDYVFCMSHWFSSTYSYDLHAGKDTFTEVGLASCALSNMPRLG
eukprot:CAMPEP_0171175100 /NCGR_PEP_ID=MMETSP0790-20130122/11060_1 /TAXON_ID=2925 /ORGANISM="Alexandrium catenella, Strain OF101" /LENGTH=371 /DNA_ID=CAMNT_0011639977 /DNA_START=51 /DNA_END=1166 /DNA_ORIENTATION=-